MGKPFTFIFAVTALVLAASGSAFAADTPVKAPPSAPAPVPYTWTGFYGGIEFGGAWSDEAVNYSGNDPLPNSSRLGVASQPRRPRTVPATDEAMARAATDNSSRRAELSIPLI
jgi:opacity protein-like surface antigen